MTDDQIRSAMRELSDRARPAKAGLADAVLRRARKKSRATRATAAGGSVLAVAAVAGLMFATPWNSGTGGQTVSPGERIGPASTPDRTAAAKPDHTCAMADDASTEKDESRRILCPPGDQDDTAEVPGLDPLPADARQVAAIRANDVWYISNPDTGELTPTEWSWISVSPHGGRLAVLKKDADRIGIMDRGSGAVEHWIDTPKGLGDVFWSPAGDQLVATVYGKAPPPDDLAPRKGFVLADPTADESGELVTLYFQGGHVDDSWSRGVFWNGDGTGLVSSYAEDQGQTLGIRLLSMDGEVEKSLPNAGSLAPADGIATSPDNRYAMAEPDKTKNRVIDLDTGQVVEKTRSFGAEVWLDDDQFIGNLAWTEITGELAVLETDGTVVNKLWKAPKDVYVDALAVSLDE